MLTTLKIFNDLTNKQIVKSTTNSTPVDLPDFYQGDNIPINFYLLRVSESGSFSQPYEIIPVSNYSNLKIGLYNNSGDTLAYQNSFLSDALNNYKYGVLYLNTQAINDAIAGKLFIDCIFEIEITDDSGNIITSYQTNTKIKRSYISNSIIAPPISDEYALKTWVLGTFIKKVPDVYEPLTFVTPGGFKYALWLDDSGQIQIQKIS